MTEPLDLEAIKARDAAATRGPWGWRGQDDGSIELRALHSGGLRIISTARAEPCLIELPSEPGDYCGLGDWVLTADACDGCKAEAAKTQDPWLNYRCSKEENLDTIWLHGEHFIEPSNKWAVRERPYRNDVERVDHPDAEFVAHAREDIPSLIAEVERLRSQGTALVQDVMASHSHTAMPPGACYICLALVEYEDALS